MLEVLFGILFAPFENFVWLAFHLGLRITDSVGTAIFFLALSVGIFILPISVWAQASQRRFDFKKTQLAPMISEIQKAFSGQERFTMLSTLYKQNGYHPILTLCTAASLVVQVPFLIATYHFLTFNGFLEGQSYTFVQDLGAPDALISALGLELNLLPILMFAAMASISLSLNLARRTRTGYLVLMAGFTTIFYHTPSGVVIYWLVALLIAWCLPTIFIRYRKTSDSGLDLRTAPLGIWVYAWLLVSAIVFIVIPLTLFLSDTSMTGMDAASIAELVWSGIFITFLATLLCRFVLRGFESIVDTIFVGVSWLAFTYTFIFIGEYGALNYYQLTNEAALNAAYELVGVDIAAVLTALIIAYLLVRSRPWLAVRTLQVLLLVTVANLTLLVIKYLPFDDARVNSLATGELPSYHQTLYGFSKTDKNILVLMMDMFTGGHIQEIGRYDPEVLMPFEGFVWYPDTLTEGSATVSGEPGIRGGHAFTPLAINARNDVDDLGTELIKGYRTFITEFGSAGYQVAIGGGDYVTCDQLRADNPAYPPAVCVSTHQLIEDYTGYYETEIRHSELSRRMSPPFLLAVSLFRVVPHFLKPTIYDQGGWMGIAETTAVKGLAAGVAKDRLSFFLGLVREPVAVASGPTLKYIQTKITHDPWGLDRQTCLPDPSVEHNFDYGLVKPGHYVAEICQLRYLAELLDWMKQQDIYDNSMIVLVSDHGTSDGNQLLDALGWEKYESKNAHALLMVKDFDATGEFRIDPALMSNADLPGIICKAKDGCDGISPDVRGAANQSRIRYHIGTPAHVHLQEKNRFKIFYGFEVTGTMFDGSNWRELDL